MRAYIDVTAKTEEDAVRKALEQLHMERDDVSVEILERAKSGFLGLGRCPAKVRLYYGPETEEKTETEQKPVEVKPEKPEKKPVRAEAEKKPAPRRAEPKKEQPAPAEEKPAPRQERREEAPVPQQDWGEEVQDEKSDAIRTFLRGLLDHLDSDATVKVYLPEKGRYKVFLEGKNLGGLIGRRGETLDAIQQLTSYAINRSGGGRVRVQLDAENYRAKREQSLQRLAHKVAGKVLRYHRNVTLEPMNAYERHVIHTALQDEEGVTTYSTGTEPNRRVIVALDREKR